MGVFICWQTPTLITIEMSRKQANKRTNEQKKNVSFRKTKCCNIAALKTFKTRSLKKLNAIHLRLMRVALWVHALVCSTSIRLCVFLLLFFSSCLPFIFLLLFLQQSISMLVFVRITTKNGNNCVFVPIIIFIARRHKFFFSLLL